jgi:hypothetical protein
VFKREWYFREREERERREREERERREREKGERREREKRERRESEIRERRERKRTCVYPTHQDHKQNSAGDHNDCGHECNKDIERSYERLNVSFVSNPFHIRHSLLENFTKFTHCDSNFNSMFLPPSVVDSPPFTYPLF